MPFFIPFLVKGAIVIGKAIIASKKASTVIKITTMAVKTNGVVAVASTTATAYILVGGIAWSVDRVDDLKLCYKHWENKDYESLTKTFIAMWSKFHSVATESIAYTGETVLIDHGYDPVHVSRFGKDLLDLTSEIIKEGKRPDLSSL